MSDKKISELQLTSSIDAQDVSILVRNDVDLQYTFTTLLQFVANNISTGANFSFGTTLPPNLTGKNGDIFLNTSAGSFAQKVSGAWSVIFTIPNPTSSGNTVLYGLGTPSAATGNDGDTYINTGTGIFYQKSSGIWVQVFSMQTGPAGATGARGADGANGTDGKSILHGNINPSNDLGTNGDFYLNTLNYTFFGPKASGIWPSGISIIGLGLPPGGSTGQAVVKASSNDYDTTWASVEPVVTLSDVTKYYRGDKTWQTLLDGTGKIVSSLLPSYVDDVIEAANFASLPSTGETGKIYVTIDTNKEYRWSGSIYIELVPSPGSTDALAEGSINLYFTNARVQAFSDMRYGVLSQPLSQFAATSSSQLAGIISDETGAGSLVFANSPTLVTPNLGTPSVLVGTNITGTASALNIGGTALIASNINNTVHTGSGIIYPTFVSSNSNGSEAIYTSGANIYYNRSNGTLYSYGGFGTPTGASSQFLKADGSVDSNTYLTTSTGGSTYQTLANLQTTVTNSSTLYPSGSAVVAYAAPILGCANYIQNQTGTPQPASFNIGGSAQIGGKLSLGAGLASNLQGVYSTYTFTNAGAGAIGHLFVTSVAATTAALAGQQQGLQASISVDPTNTQNWNGGNGARAITASALVSPGSIGTITSIGSLYLLYTNSSTGAIVTNGFIIKSPPPILGTSTNFAYWSAGTSSQNAGNWFIEASSVTYPTALGGNLQLGGIIPTVGAEKLQVTGAASISSIANGATLGAILTTDVAGGGAIHYSTSAQLKTWAGYYTGGDSPTFANITATGSQFLYQPASGNVLIDWNPADPTTPYAFTEVHNPSNHSYQALIYAYQDQILLEVDDAGGQSYITIANDIVALGARTTSLSTESTLQISPTTGVTYNYGGAGTVFSIGTGGNVKASKYLLSALNTAPSSSTDIGELGEIRVTSGYIYVCIAANTWVRAALSSF